MKQGIVKFSKEFVTPIGTKEWVGVEMEYDMSTECPRDVLTNAKTIVEQWHISNSQGILASSIPPGPPPVINVERTSEDKRIAELIRDIYACTQLAGDNGLWTYYKLASTCKEAQSAYDVMNNKLTKQESQQLLDKTKAYYKDANKPIK
jgi:hypothetical protein